MNANAYGGELARVLEWVDVVTAVGPRPARAGPTRASPTGARTSARRDRGPGVVRARRPPTAEEVKATLADDARAGARRRSRPGSRPSARRSRTPTTRARRAGRRASCSRPPAAAGLRIGGASFSAKHANFVENHGDATTADVIALMAEGRRRVRERFGVELEPEVQTLGPVAFPTRLRRRMIDGAARRRAAPRRRAPARRVSPRPAPGALAPAAAPAAHAVLVADRGAGAARRRVAVAARLLAGRGQSASRVIGASGADAGQIRSALVGRGAQHDHARRAHGPAARRRWRRTRWSRASGSAPSSRTGCGSAWSSRCPSRRVIDRPGARSPSPATGPCCTTSAAVAHAAGDSAARRCPGGTRLTDPHALARPWRCWPPRPPRCSRRVEQVTTDRRARPRRPAAQRAEHLLRRHDPARAPSGPRVAAVLADPGSAGAVYIDVTDPERPAAGGAGRRPRRRVDAPPGRPRPAAARDRRRHDRHAAGDGATAAGATALERRRQQPHRRRRAGG